MRSTTLIALFVIGLLAVTGSSAAVPAPRDQPADTTPPVRVFVGETLNISAVELSGGGTIGTDSVTLVGVGGDADGELHELSDPTTADFADVPPGTYYVDGDTDNEIDIVVTEPHVTSLTITNQNGANVTNDWEPTGEDLTVTAEYNFEAADRLDVSVRDSSGLDITGEVATNDRITTSGGAIHLDLSSEPDGTYRITATGSTLEDASQTVTVRTGPRETATTPAPTSTTALTTASPHTTTTQLTTTTTPAVSTAEPTETATPTATTSVPASPTQTTTTSTSTPGFGLLVTLVVVLAAAGMVSRRT